MFSQAYITAVNPPQVQGRELYLSWSSSAPAGTPYQVYINSVLSWYGFATSCYVPIPGAATGTLHVDIGTVLPSEIKADFSADLPGATPKRRLDLQWEGGTFEDPDIAGFHIYGSPAPGAAIDYTAILEDVVAYPGGIATDGFGFGGFGNGGFGASANTYTWTTPSLASGTWSYAIVPYDIAGNEGTGITGSGVITAPPSEPPVYPGTNTRLKYQLLGWGQIEWGAGGFGMPEIQLFWQASTA